MSDIGVALAGGAVGAVITAMIGQAGRARLAWAEVTLHDDDATERNRQLVAWTDDRTLRLVLEMKGLTEKYSARGGFNSSPHGAALARAKADALHEFRDREWSTRLDLAALRATEGAWHHFWRVVRRRSAPDITVRAEIEPFLERWREPVERHGPAVTPIDRTRRTTSDALAELQDLPLT